jgi:hypothetical protein
VTGAAHVPHDLPPVKVLFVMGHGGSGTTIFGNVLGELDGFFHPGELRTLWDEGMKGVQRCGCGLPVPECPVWSQVIEMGFGQGSPTPLDVDAFGRWHLDGVRVRHTLSILRLKPGQPTGHDALDRYLPVADRLYRAVGAATGARVVVDTSKRAGDAAILPLLPGVVPYFVHLVRDPRAVAYSYHRRNTHNRASATMKDWVPYALLHEAVRRRVGQGRSMRLRFEDFVARPRETVRAVAKMVREPADGIAFLDDHTVALSPNHTMSGHWGRFDTGRTELRLDTSWLSQQPARERRVATALSLPLLLRYRYPLRPSPGRS